MQFFGSVCPDRRGSRCCLRERFNERVGGRVDCQRRAENPPQLVRVGMHVDEFLVRIGAFDQRIVRRRHFAETPANQENKVCLLDVSGKFRVDADAAITGIAWMLMVEQRLTPERAANRKRPAFQGQAQLVDSVAVPARAAANDEWPFSLFE